MVMFRLSWSQSCSYFLVHDVTKLCTWVTRRVLLMGQKLLTLPNHLRFASVFFWDLYCSDFFFYVVTGYFVDTFFFRSSVLQFYCLSLFDLWLMVTPLVFLINFFGLKQQSLKHSWKLRFLLSQSAIGVFILCCFDFLLLLNHSSYTNLRCSVHCQK